MNYNRPFIFGKENYVENKNPKNQTVEKFKISNEISVNSEVSIYQIFSINKKIYLTKNTINNLSLSLKEKILMLLKYCK